MAMEGWLATVAKVDCRKFTTGVTEGGGQSSLTEDDHQIPKIDRQTSQSLKQILLGLKNSNDRHAPNKK
ncbi:hypothetical protein Csa_000457 [Cucumis sativus]|uniref:Uncharacterized protein n=1 Tax=Cucumis sativus TaxID=3659 RepID=A0A0A0KLK7_CUCSA|nr:hypothetical protein Csa_000457 [Cucumis sativus]